MAFHPLRTFQKHRKRWLAGVTILAMFTFVMSFSITGGGDLFGQLGRWVGAESARYPTIAKLYNKKLDQRDLVRVNQRRQLANTFITRATGMVQQEVQGKVFQAMGKWDSTLQREFMMALQQSQSITGMMRSFDLLREDLIAQNKKDDAALIGQYLAVIHQQQRISNQRMSGDQFYFGGSTRTESLLDFMIWLHQADQLGIQLTEKDIKELVDRETLQLLTSNASDQVLRNVLGERGRGNSFQELLSSLGDEFRVRLAQATLLGYDPTSPTTQVPAPVTPHEFWEFYKAYRTEISAALLPIPVKEFVAKVQEKPTEEQLRELFEKHKNDEYRPSAATPGFKQPERINVEWVSARPDDEHYKKAAKQIVLGTVAASASNPWAGVSAAVAAADLYRSEKFNHLLPPLTDPTFAAHFTTRPEAVTAAWGQAVTGAFSGTPGLSALAAYQSVQSAQAGKPPSPAFASELKRRIPAGATAILAGSTSPWSAAALTYYGSSEFQYMPMEALAVPLADRLHKQLARELVSNNLDEVRKAFDAKKGKPEEAAKALPDLVKKFALATGKTEKARDQYDLASDAGLKPVKDAYLKTHPQDLRAKQFASQFFAAGKPYEAQSMPTGDETILYWKTSDKPAYVPSFAEVREQVEAAWKFAKARTLAEQEAKQVAEKARQADKEKGAVDVLTKASPNSGAMFTLDSVARIRPRLTTRLGVRKEYEPYPVPEDKVEYPGRDFIEKLLTIKDKSDALVLHDGPESVYYVAALVNRREPTLEEFAVVYRNAPAGGIQPDPLLGYFEEEKRTRYVLACTEQLRADAKLTILSENLRRASDETEDQ